MSATGLSIVGLISERKWKRALFTTYTLSLSYFETEILPALRGAGCTDIWLIADAEGYRSSLLERRSMGVGHEYRLIPVALSQGIFHAKSIYLSGDEGDLLLVGSGNLTFAGHGRNLEVFEALVPEHHGLAFADFAAYLEAIRERTDIKSPRTDWIDTFSQAARIASQGQDGSVRLLHSVTEPVISQLPDVLAKDGACSSVAVMSPYHDSDGLAVRRLAETQGGAPVAVAVQPWGSSPFPFHTASSWPFPVKPVRTVPIDNRFVHAKIYEFFFPDHHVFLTGSINATRQALTTTNNIELGVIRRAPSDHPLLEWHDVDVPDFEAPTQIPGDLGKNEVVFAAFNKADRGSLSGSILSLQSVAGTWTARLMRADGENLPFEVEVDALGGFTHESCDLEPFSDFPALQIVMNHAGREARGWIHNEVLLSLSGSRRLTALSLSRLLRREGSSDDIEMLLNYLSMHAENHLGIFDQPLPSAEREGDHPSPAETVVSVSLEEIAPIEEHSYRGLSGAFNSHDRTDAFDLTIQRLRSVFLGSGRHRTGEVSVIRDSTVAEEDIGQLDREDPLASSERDQRRLADFESTIGKLIARGGDSPSRTRALLVLQLEVGMWIRLHRLADSDSAHQFLRSWLQLACSSTRAEPEKITSLEQHIVTGAAVCFLLAEDAAKSENALGLHDALEKFYGGDIDHLRMLHETLPDEESAFSFDLLDPKTTNDALMDGLKGITAHPTTRQQIIRALELAAIGEPIPRDLTVFQSEIGMDLHKALEAPNWQKRVRASAGTREACAFDYHALSLDAAAKYRRYRIGVCIHCGRFTLNVSP